MEEHKYLYNKYRDRFNAPVMNTTGIGTNFWIVEASDNSIIDEVEGCCKWCAAWKTLIKWRKRSLEIA